MLQNSSTQGRNILDQSDKVCALPEGIDGSLFCPKTSCVNPKV